MKSSSAAVAGLMLGSTRLRAGQGDGSPTCRFGIVTDSHYADIDDAGTRYYRQSVEKMTECVELMNDKKVDFLVELGDFINGAPSGNLANLRMIEGVFAKFNGPRYHVLGNHDMEGLAKTQFQSIVENTDIPKERTYYSFNRNGAHFVVLDANFRADGMAYDSGNYKWTDANLPKAQLDWLEKDLAATDRPAVIFIHQLLDGDKASHYVRNAAEARQVISKYPRVLAVFQGHQHRGQYKRVADIHYYTLKAMVEGADKTENAYAIVEVLGDGSLTVTGYRRATSGRLTPIHSADRS
ncbi:MAG: alkaline phosphatase [Pirellulaceae bacterium]|nr:alkaline phosphatase [Pirellulaceae bacterium]